MPASRPKLAGLRQSPPSPHHARRDSRAAGPNFQRVSDRISGLCVRDSLLGGRGSRRAVAIPIAGSQARQEGSPSEKLSRTPFKTAGQIPLPAGRWFDYTRSHLPFLPAIIRRERHSMAGVRPSLSNLELARRAGDARNRRFTSRRLDVCGDVDSAALRRHVRRR